MNAKKIMPILLSVLALLSFLAASCGGRDTSTDVAVIVALTQTAAALQNPPAVPATQPPAADIQPPLQVPASGYLPLDGGECNALNNTLSGAVGYPGSVMSPVPFEDFVSSQYGAGCQIEFHASGLDMDNSEMLGAPAKSTLESLGWVEDMNYGAGGAGGYATAYRKDSTLCLMVVSAQPADAALCPNDQPISVCWEGLAPEQKSFSLTLNCSTYVP